jgi:hypothetical protein
MTEAFPWDFAPRYLLRDRDASYGPVFRDRVRVMGIKEVVTAPRSPSQNAYVVLPTFGPSTKRAPPNMPSADSCAAIFDPYGVRVPRLTINAAALIPFRRRWRGSQNKTANTYVIEIII